MKFDNYCIALVVLVLFFLYLDNSMNVEGMAVISEDSDKKVEPPSPPPQLDVRDPSKEVPATKQNIDPIGAKPQKLKPMNTPPSMKSGLEAVSSSASQLSSLDSAFAPLIDPQLIPNQMPADLESLGSRVGGVGNVGNSKLGGVGGPVPSGAVNGSAPSPYSDVDELMGSPLMVMGMPPTMAESPPASPPAPAAPPAKPAKPAGPKKKIEVHMVYTDWCGHSKRALPHFDKVQQEYHGKDLGSHVVEVHKHDAETPEGKEMAKQHDVKGFPTHFIMVEGQKIEDGIGRTYDELVSKIHELTGM